MEFLRRRPAVAAGIGAFAFFTAAVAVRGKLTAPPTAYNEQYRMATYLAHGTGFVCPVGPERSDPSSWYAPGYIAAISLLIRLFGEDTAASLAAIRLVNLAALGAAAGVYFALGRRLLDRATAGVALVLTLLSPLLLAKAEEIWDTSWTMLSGACALYLLVVVRPRRSVSVFSAGLLCGALAMINPVFTLCYVVWGVWGWWRSRPARGRPRDVLRRGGLLAAGFLLALTPWTLRNYMTFGRVLYLRGNLPLEIWVGNAPWSDGQFFTRTEPRRRIHPVFDPKETRRMVRLGEFGYFQACRRDVSRWWQRDKGRFFRLGLRRVWWYWMGRYDLLLSPLEWAAKVMGYLIPTLLACGGAVFIALRCRRALGLVVTLLVFALPYYATVVMVRYRVPIEPLLLLVGAFGLTSLWGIIRRRRAGAVSGTPGSGSRAGG